MYRSRSSSRTFKSQSSTERAVSVSRSTRLRQNLCRFSLQVFFSSRFSGSLNRVQNRSIDVHCDAVWLKVSLEAGLSMAAYGGRCFEISSLDVEKTTSTRVVLVCIRIVWWVCLTKLLEKVPLKQLRTQWADARGHILRAEAWSGHNSPRGVTEAAECISTPSQCRNMLSL